MKRTFFEQVGRGTQEDPFRLVPIPPTSELTEAARDYFDHYLQDEARCASDCPVGTDGGVGQHNRAKRLQAALEEAEATNPDSWPEPHHIGRSNWDGTFDDGWPLAEAVCLKRLIVTDSSVEAGKLRLGTKRFEKWVLAVEAALEKVNPKT